MLTLLGYLAVAVIYYRCSMIYRYLTGPNAHVHMQLIQHQYFSGKYVFVRWMLESTVRGMLLGLTLVYSLPHLTAALVFHCCVSLAAITTTLKHYGTR